MLPLLAVGGMMVARTVAKAAHKPDIGARCVVAAFYILFFVCALRAN